MTGGGVAVRADPNALERLTAIGSSAVETFRATVRSVGELQAQVRAGCGHRAAWGDGLDHLGRLLTDVDETAALTDETRSELLAADAPGSPLSSTGGHSLGPLIWPGPPTVGGSTIPWFDPGTDSWVVGLLRTGVQARPPKRFVDRLLADGPGLATDLTDHDITAADQLLLLSRDRDRFADNWGRTALGALDGLVGVGTAAVGGAAVLTPGMDDTVERITGRRPGAETTAGMAVAANDLLFDPDSVAESTIGWEQYRNDPYRWFGMMLPEAVFEGATAAVPLLPARRGVSAAIDLPPTGARPGGPGPALSPRLGLDTPTAGPFPDLDEFRRLEGDWAPADPIVSHRAGPFESPEGWIADVNGDGSSAPGRGTNCIDCARAVEANWRGDDAVAAPLADPSVPGLTPDRLEDWTGGRFRGASVDEIEIRLTELGPGSSAIVTSAWDTGGAHAYNALNDAGTVKWVDGQGAEVTTWPPPYAEHVDASIVIFIDPDGTPK